MQSCTNTYQSVSAQRVLVGRLNILAFATEVASWKSRLVAGNEKNKSDACQWILTIKATGGSCLLQALKVQACLVASMHVL